MDCDTVSKVVSGLIMIVMIPCSAFVICMIADPDSLLEFVKIVRGKK